jgi:hypothetical protein
MKIFTTIFLAEKSSAKIDGVEEFEAPDWTGLIEFEQSLRERIVTLEVRHWFQDDGTNP